MSKHHSVWGCLTEWLLAEMNLALLFLSLNICSDNKRTDWATESQSWWWPASAHVNVTWGWFKLFSFNQTNCFTVWICCCKHAWCECVIYPSLFFLRLPIMTSSDWLVNVFFLFLSYSFNHLVTPSICLATLCGGPDPGWVPQLYSSVVSLCYTSSSSSLCPPFLCNKAPILTKSFITSHSQPNLSSGNTKIWHSNPVQALLINDITQTLWPNPAPR